ncbi:MAG: replicative DNA helicase [Nitrospirae bacterium]|nr:replicative DNA helicase [Nitrospirota bacterium]
MSADSTIHKLPPQNLEAEQCVLGAILIENDAINKALEVVREEDFYSEKHRLIFRAMVDLNGRGVPVDLITLSEQLTRDGVLDRGGGASYLVQLTDVIPTAANVRSHGRIIRQAAITRGLIKVGTEIAERGYVATERVEELLDFAERSVFAISERQVRPSFVPVKEVLKNTFEVIETLYDRQEMVTGVPTGFGELDRMTAGLQPSDLIVVAGRPSMGKTALAMTIAQQAGIAKSAGSVAVFSLEMSKEQLVTRMLCSEARVDASKLRTGHFSKSDWPKLTNAAGRLAEAAIFIDDTPAMTVLDMRTKARRLMAEHGLGMIVVDYLQLMRGRANADSREQEISDISRSLKALAKELNVPVVALSQLSRAVESRTDKRPMLSDLRESGAIEQDADVVMFVYREEFYKHCDCPAEGVCECGRRGRAELIIGKQRNGPIGTVKLAFLSNFVRFESLDETHDEATQGYAGP